MGTNQAYLWCLLNTITDRLSNHTAVITQRTEQLAFLEKENCHFLQSQYAWFFHQVAFTVAGHYYWFLVTSPKNAQEKAEFVARIQKGLVILPELYKSGKD